MKDYSFWITDHIDFSDGWRDDLTIAQVTTLTNNLTGIGLQSVMLEPFKSIRFCGEGLNAEVEKITRTIENLTLQLCKYNPCPSSHDVRFHGVHWEVYVVWKSGTHHVEFRESTNDVVEVLRWIFKIIWPGCTFPYIPSAIVPPKITKEYPGLE
jgi:hypothetical protein